MKITANKIISAEGSVAIFNSSLQMRASACAAEELDKTKSGKFPAMTVSLTKSDI